MNTDIYGTLTIALGILLLASLVTPIMANKRRFAGLLNFIFMTAAGAILLFVSYQAVFNNGGEASRLLNFGPVSIHFLVDSFSGIFIGLIALMAMVSAFYSIQYMEHYPDYSLRGYLFCYPIFIFGMVSLVTVDDLSLGFTIAWQAMTIASYFLIRFESRKEGIIKSANKYLALMELAWVIIIGSTFLINGYTFGASIHEITAGLSGTGIYYQYIIYGLLLVGFGFKAGVFPLGQLWLPDAHSIAPSPISSLLSGVMLKTGIYGILRTFFWMVPHDGIHVSGTVWGIVIASVGAVTLFIGTAQSMKQSDSKRLLAYSSIGQVGYIVFAIGAALTMFNAENEFVKMLAVVTIVGAVYHIMNHAIFKGLLFLSSGSILYATGTKDLNKLGGLLKIMPITAIIAGIASLSIAGVPPFSGFFSKWSIISSSLLAGGETAFLVVFGIVALFTSPITLACYVKFFGMTFASSGVEWNVEHEIKEVPAMMIIPKVFLVIISLVQGLLPFVFYRTIISVFQNSEGSIVYSFMNSINYNEFINMSGAGIGIKGAMGMNIAAASPVLIIAVVGISLIAALLLRKSGGSKETTADTWLCGYQNLHNYSRYTDKSMFSSLKNLLWWTGGNVKEK